MTEEESREMTRNNSYALMRASGFDRRNIPVEWINNYLCKMLKGQASFEACGAIAAMLSVWDKECEENV